MDFEKQLEEILTSETGGEVRVSYPDGTSEIKDAKILLYDDILEAHNASLASEREKIRRWVQDEGHSSIDRDDLLVYLDSLEKEDWGKVFNEMADGKRPIIRRNKGE